MPLVRLSFYPAATATTAIARAYGQAVATAEMCGLLIAWRRSGCLQHYRRLVSSRIDGWEPAGVTNRSVGNSL